MPSRSPRSRSRSPSSRRHKKSHKRSKRSREKGSPPPVTNTSVKKHESPVQENGVHNDIVPSSSFMTPPSDLTKLDLKEEEKAVTPSGDQSPADSTATNTQTTRRRKRRFGDETERVFLPHMPTNISTSAMTDQQQKVYILQLRIEDLTRRLKSSDYGISTIPENRSPSPEPIYDQHGKRQNTREVRARRKIEDERHRIITELLVLNPEYKAPADYKPQLAKFSDKVLIPQEDHSEVNFVGLIIGPRGSTLKGLEKDTGAKIIIRGKGSVKDGKMGLIKYGPMPGEDEPLHAYISGATAEIVAQAVEKVNEIINRAIDEPDGMNEMRKHQLRELALLQGTFRENDCLIKLKLMDEADKVITNTIICTICGGAGHVPSDCKFRKNADGSYAELNPDGSLMVAGVNRAEQQKLDCEYESLMNELTGKKDSSSTTLSFEDQRNLMTGVRTTGPTLAIGGATSTANAPPAYDHAAAMNTNNAYNAFNAAMSYGTNTSSANQQQQQQQQYQQNYHYQQPAQQQQQQQTPSSNHQWSTAGPRYNNNDVFDGHYLLRRHQRTNNYSTYYEGDAYRARHIPALMEGNNGANNANSSNSWSNAQYSQPWNQQNASTPYQNSYQQQYYPSNNTGFVPPLPKSAPPPPPPPY